MKSKSSVLSAAILAVLLAVPALRARATTAAAPATIDINNPMKEAKQTSYQLRENVDRLHAITRSGGHSRQSHSWYLNAAREEVNRLGKMLTNLEEIKHYGSETQQMAIESMRPRLVETANALTNAIELLNDRPHNVYFPEYREAVQTVAEQTASLHQTLDVVLDYEAAKARLNSLEFLPSAEPGA